MDSTANTEDRPAQSGKTSAVPVPPDTVGGQDAQVFEQAGHFRHT